MSKKERDGIKKPRSARATRQFELGNYRIVTDTDNSERFFFEGLKASLPPDIRNKIEIIVSKKTHTKNLVIAAADIIGTFKETWIVFDRDQVPNFNELIAEADNRGISVAWSNPCIEIWFLAYYGTMPDGLTSVQCCEKFGAVFRKNTGEAYNKNDSAIYRKLLESGDEEKAVDVAVAKYKKWEKQRGEENTPYSEMNACTRMFEIVAEIRSKTGY